MFVLQRRSSKRAKNNHKDNVLGNQFNLELNHYYKDIEFVPRNVSNVRAFNTEYIEVITKPFRAYKLKKFFKTSVAEAIYKEITNLQFTTKRNDLFTLQQTSDLSSFPEESPVYWLRNFFDYQVRHVLEIIYKKELDGILSISLSKYNDTCHLLCHDDMVSNRDVAFICYLNDWDPKNGGLLEMFSCDKYGRPSKVENIVNPTFNTLLCFEVCSTSYHQVSEVVTQLPKYRYAISGWFHSTAAEKRHIPKQIKVLESELPVKFPLLFGPMYDVGELLQHVPKYYTSNSRQSAQKFEEDGVLLLNSFVKDYLYNEMSVELKGNRINWVREGPPNVRNTERAVLDYDSTDGLIPDCPCLSAVLDSMRSSTFLNFIYYILGINFETVDIRLEVAVNRWSWKTFTLSNSLGNYELYSSIELFLFLNIDNIAANLDEGTSGTLHNFSNFDAFIAPSKNTLVILNRPPGDMSPYLKYVNNHFRDTCFHSIRIRYFAVAVDGV